MGYGWGGGEGPDPVAHLTFKWVVLLELVLTDILRGDQVASGLWLP